MITIQRFVQFLGPGNHINRIRILGFVGKKYVLLIGKRGFCKIPI